MPRYHYRLITQEKKVLTGSVNARSARAAERELIRHEAGATVLYVRPEKRGLLRIELPSLNRGFSAYDRIIFFRNLATMASAGLSLNNILTVLGEQARTAPVKRAVAAMRADVENGKTLSEAMKRFPRLFPEYITETVAMGEVAGRMSEMFDRISIDLEHDYEITKKVQGAMAYPVVVTTVMALVLVGITSFVLPKIAELFEELHTPLPATTAFLLSGSVFIRTHPIALSLAVAGIVAFFILALRNKRFRTAVHHLILRIPLFGELAREFNLARFFRALEAVFASGISLVRSVDVAKKTLRNEAYRDALDDIGPVLTAGTPLSDALKTYPFLFPLQTQRIIEIGEKSGKLDDVFIRTTAYYERAIKYKTSMLSTLIEPFLILLVGGAVGGIAVSVFLPIYQLSSAF